MGDLSVPDWRRCRGTVVLMLCGVLLSWRAAAAAPETPSGPLPASGAGAPFDGSAEQRELAQQAAAGVSAEDRYRWLAALEAAYAGDAAFDYPLGALALDTGRFSEAVFVLQRVVARRPEFSGARMDLARAYYALGDNESARREFTRLQAENPPPGVRRAIAQYLQAIDQRAASYQAQQGVFAEVASGYDSNANGAPDLQNFIGFDLDTRSQSTASGYYGVGLGGTLSRPLAPTWRAVASGLASHRGYPDASFVDAQALRLGGGIEWHPARWVVSLVPNGAYVMLDGQENHQLLAADGSAAYDLGSGALALVLRYARKRFADSLAVLDTDTVLYGVTSEAAVAALPRLRFHGAITAGSDEAVTAGSPFGRDLLGVRAGATAALGGGSSLTLSVASLGSDYDGAFFGQTRSDDQLSVALAYESGLWREAGWGARVQLGYVDNASTVALYEYERVDAGIVLRREFR